ncbi:hypothetical protein B484DRAFT_231826 [Ochromonadaceae sp. CCMP2298]|nr:hypothetical protein B484DRAFT_231826 [Ochromonadaceae sp. CCMP2298]
MSPVPGTYLACVRISALNAELQDHLAQEQLERARYEEAKTAARANPHRHISIIVDGAAGRKRTVFSASTTTTS